MGLLACFNKETMCSFGNKNPFKDQAVLRYKAFRQFGWEVPYFDGKTWEEDEYDISPYMTYVVYYDDDGVALGSARLGRTDQAFLLKGEDVTFMMKDVFNGRANKRLTYLPNEDRLIAPNIIEGTRFAIAPELLTKESGERRRQVISEITLGILEFCHAKNFDTIIGVMPPKVWSSVWEKRKCTPDFVGPVVTLDSGEDVRAGKLMVSARVIAEMREATGLEKSSLFAPEIGLLSSHSNKLPQSESTIAERICAND